MKIKKISYYKTVGFFFFRFFGHGFIIKDTTKCPLLFSERNKIIKGLRVGKYYFRTLK